MRASEITSVTALKLSTHADRRPQETTTSQRNLIYLFTDLLSKNAPQMQTPALASELRQQQQTTALTRRRILQRSKLTSIVFVEN